MPFSVQELRHKNNPSPLDSGGSAVDSCMSDTNMTTLNSPYRITDEDSSPDGVMHRYQLNGQDMMINGGTASNRRQEDEDGESKCHLDFVLLYFLLFYFICCFMIVSKQSLIFKGPFMFNFINCRSPH